MAGSVPAAGISPVFSFNRTGGKKQTKLEKKKKRSYFHTSLTSRLILSARHWLRAAFPAAFLPGVGPSQGSRARGDRRSCQRRRGAQREEAAAHRGAEHSRAGTPVPGSPEGPTPPQGPSAGSLELPQRRGPSWVCTSRRCQMFGGEEPSQAVGR